jgi:hypothetical protein
MGLERTWAGFLGLGAMLLAAAAPSPRSPAEPEVSAVVQLDQAVASLRVFVSLRGEERADNLRLRLPPELRPSGVGCVPRRRCVWSPDGLVPVVPLPETRPQADPEVVAVELADLSGFLPDKIGLDLPSRGGGFRTQWVPIHAAGRERLQRWRQELGELPPSLVAGESFFLRTRLREYQPSQWQLETAGGAVAGASASAITPGVLLFKVPAELAAGTVVTLSFAAPDQRVLLRASAIVPAPDTASLKAGFRQPPAKIFARPGQVLWLSGSFPSVPQQLAVSPGVNLEILAGSPHGVLIQIPDDLALGEHEITSLADGRLRVGIVEVGQSFTSVDSGHVRWSLTVRGTDEPVALQLGAVSLPTALRAVTSGGQRNTAAVEMRRVPGLFFGSVDVGAVEAAAVKPERQALADAPPVAGPSSAEAAGSHSAPPVPSTSPGASAPTDLVTQVRQDLRAIANDFARRRRDVGVLRVGDRSFYVGEVVGALALDTRDKVVGAIHGHAKFPALYMFVWEEFSAALSGLPHQERWSGTARSYRGAAGSGIAPARFDPRSARVTGHFIPQEQGDSALSRISRILEGLVEAPDDLRFNVCFASHPSRANVTIFPKSLRDLTYRTTTDSTFPEPLWVGRYQYEVTKDGFKTATSVIDLIEKGKIPKAYLCSLVRKEKGDEAEVCTPMAGSALGEVRCPGQP